MAKSQKNKTALNLQPSIEDGSTLANGEPVRSTTNPPPPPPPANLNPDSNAKRIN